MAGDDDPEAKKTLMFLVEDTGFDAIDGGSLAESWQQQPGTPAYCANETTDELQSALAAADRARAPQVRDQIMKVVLALGDKLTNEDLVRFNRSLSA